MRILLPVVLAAAALAVQGSSARSSSSAPLLTYSVLYSADKTAGVVTDGGVCATGPEGHSFRVTDPYQDLFPAWAPDGKHIAFTRYLERVPGSVGNISDVYVADATGGHLRNLSARIGGNLNGGSSWSPDGSKVAFTGGWYGESLVVANADGTKSKDIANGRYLGRPAWSPDGRRILFARYEVGSAVYVIDPDGSNEAKLVDSAGAAVWSPDGTRIAYLAGNGPLAKVVVAHADGSDPQGLTDYGRFGELAWSPDGQWIAFPEGTQLMVIKPDGTGEHAADTDGLPTRDPAWLPAADLPPNRRPCVINGTPHANVIRGTRRGDLINGRGGRDTIYGLGGDDLLIGGTGRDRLYGGAGRDLFGATDGYRDVLRGGSGYDTAYFDKHDRLNSVEPSN